MRLLPVLIILRPLMLFVPHRGGGGGGSRETETDFSLAEKKMLVYAEA